MSGLGIVCNCCDSQFNVCSFASDGTLRWTKYWSAIDSSNGGMSLVERESLSYNHQIGLFAVGSKLLAIGDINGTIKVATLNLSDGSESLALTSTGHTPGMSIWHYGTRFYETDGSTVVFGGLNNVATKAHRMEIDSSGNLTTTTSSHSGYNHSSLSPAGELAAVDSYVDSGQDYIRVSSYDASGQSGTSVLELDNYDTRWALDTEYLYFRSSDSGEGTVDQYVRKFALPVSGGPSSVTAVGDRTLVTSLMNRYAMSKVDAEHIWCVRKGGTNAVSYFDLVGQSTDWNGAYASTNMISARSFHLGPDNVMYFVDAATSGAIHVSGVDASGNVCKESATIANNIYSDENTRVFADASGHVVIGWMTSAGDAHNIARFTKDGTDLDIEWQWEGVPSLASTVDSSGNLYCAQIETNATLSTSGLAQVV